MLVRKRKLLAMTLLVGTGLGVWPLARFLRSAPPGTDLKGELQSIVSDLVRKDGSVRNCVLSITAGDGALVWSGAAGIARFGLPA